MTGCGYLGNPCRHSNALNTADTTAGTIPSSMKEGDENGRRHYTIRAIPYQDPRQEAERLKAVHEARVKIVPRV
jgi:hypothetical protein